MPHIDSNISNMAKYGVISFQFHRFPRLCLSKESFITQCNNLISLLILKWYNVRKTMKKAHTFLNRKSFIYGISALGLFREIEQKLETKSGELNSPLFF